MLVRTGDMAARRHLPGWGGYAAGDAPGLSLLAAPWLYEHEIRGRSYRQVVLSFFVGNHMERRSEEGRWWRLAP